MRPRGWQLSLLLFKHSARFVELCVCQNSPGLCFPGSMGRSRDVLVAELGNSTLKRPCVVPGSCLSPRPCKGLHYPVEGVNSLGSASFGIQVRILDGVSNTSACQGTWLATGNSYVIVSCWTKTNAGDEWSSWHRFDVLSARTFSDL